jgi:hypothetical protein
MNVGRPPTTDATRARGQVRRPGRWSAWRKFEQRCRPAKRLEICPTRGRLRAPGAGAICRSANRRPAACRPNRGPASGQPDRMATRRKHNIVCMMDMTVFIERLARSLARSTRPPAFVGAFRARRLVTRQLGRGPEKTGRAHQRRRANSPDGGRADCVPAATDCAR